MNRLFELPSSRPSPAMQTLASPKPDTHGAAISRWAAERGPGTPWAGSITRRPIRALIKAASPLHLLLRHARGVKSEMPHAAPSKECPGKVANEN